MTSGIRYRWSREAEQFKKRASLDVRWKTMESDGEQSIVSLNQLFIEKSQTYLKAGFLKFYPPLLIALNFADDACRYHITHHRILLPYFPVEFKYLEAKSTVRDNHSARVPLSHIDVLQTLRVSVDLALKSFPLTSLSGVHASTSDDYRFLAHRMLFSDVANNPDFGRYTVS